MINTYVFRAEIQLLRKRLTEALSRGSKQESEVLESGEDSHEIREIVEEDSLHIDTQ